MVCLLSSLLLPLSFCVLYSFKRNTGVQLHVTKRVCTLGYTLTLYQYALTIHLLYCNIGKYCANPFAAFFVLSVCCLHHFLRIQQNGSPSLHLKLRPCFACPFTLRVTWERIETVTCIGIVVGGASANFFGEGVKSIGVRGHWLSRESIETGGIRGHGFFRKRIETIAPLCNKHTHPTDRNDTNIFQKQIQIPDSDSRNRFRKQIQIPETDSDSRNRFQKHIPETDSDSRNRFQKQIPETDSRNRFQKQISSKIQQPNSHHLLDRKAIANNQTTTTSWIVKQ